MIGLALEENKMKKLIIDQLVVMDGTSRLGKVIDFLPGINVVTSTQEGNGSRAGKSVMMRSLFYAFGAEARFDRRMWDCGRSYYYIVKFHIGSDGYFAIRSGNFFRFLSQEKKEIFKTAIRSELNLFVSHLLGISLLAYNEKSGIYELADTNSYFVFHYLEQQSTEVCSFSQFVGLPSDRRFYSDTIYQSLGSNRKDLFEESKKWTKAHESLLDLNNKRKSIDGVLSEMSQMVDAADLPSFDVLKKEIEINKEKIVLAQKEVGKRKEELFRAYDEQNHLRELIDGIENYLEQKQNDKKWVSSAHKCPYCKNEIPDPSEIFLATAMEKEQTEIDKEHYQSELREIERQINDLEMEYKKAVDGMDDLEKELFGSQSDYESILTKYSYRDLKKRVVSKRFMVDENIQGMEKIERDLSKKIASMKSQEAFINKTFVTILSEMHTNYDNSGVVIDKVETADTTAIENDGNSIHSAQTLWMCSLLRAKAFLLKETDSVYLPIVFDDPVNADFDNSLRDSIIRMAFDSIADGGQVIVSEVGFKTEMYKEKYKPNVIWINNPREHVLNEGDYQKGILLYKDFFPSSFFNG
jgi:hypothetical protein